MNKLYFLLCLPVILTLTGCPPNQFYTSNKEARLNAAPMPGYSTMKEVAIWVQSQDEAYVIIEYRPKGSSEAYAASNGKFTKEYKGFSEIIKIGNLEPGTQYEYRVLLNHNVQAAKYVQEFETQTLWQWREDPPSVSFAAGSCMYLNEAAVDRPGTPYGSQMQILDLIADKDPNFMLWLGDNVYLREVDWNSMSGILHRYSAYRADPAIQKLLSSTHHYATWDDHDFGPNDSDRSYNLKDSTLAAFNYMWPATARGFYNKPAVTSKFQWNDCEFFLLDNRYYRTPNNRKTGERFILGDEQIEWLMDNLKNSLASFKFVSVGGQFLSTAAVWENHAVYPEEREKILELLNAEDIKNVVFLTGDRHHTEFSKLTLENGNDVYDLTISPLTSGSHNARNEGNTLQIEGSMIHVQNYGFLEVSGPFNERSLLVKIFDAQDKELTRLQIEQQ